MPSSSAPSTPVVQVQKLDDLVVAGGICDMPNINSAEDYDELSNDDGSIYSSWDAGNCSADNTGTIRLEGWLCHSTSSKKSTATANTKSSSILRKRQASKQRFFVLRGNTLSYYSRKNDVKARGTFILTRHCTVGSVVSGALDEHKASEETLPVADSNTVPESKTKKKRRQYYCVQVSWPMNNQPSRDEKMMAQAKAQVAAESEKEALQQRDESIPIKLSRSSLIRNRSGGIKSPKKLGGSNQPHIDPLSDDLAPPNLEEDCDDCPSATEHGLSITTPAIALAGAKLMRQRSGEGSQSNEQAPSPSPNHETGLHKHYTQQIAKHAKEQEKSQEELQKIMRLLSIKESHEKTKKKLIQGTKVAAVSGAAITAGVLTAGISLAAGLLFVGITAAAGGSSVVGGKVLYSKARGKYYSSQSQKSFHLVIGASTFEEAMKWKKAMEHAIKELTVMDGGVEDATLGVDSLSHFVGKEKAKWGSKSDDGGAIGAPRSPGQGAPATPGNDAVESDYSNTPRWVPLNGGGLALWGILGTLGGNLRIHKEEPRFRSNVGEVDQPFPPLKASLVLRGNCLDTFMCLMCCGRIGESALSGIPLPNSGQLASFRIIETIDDHMDVIQLFFRPLYLFPSWTAPRDFVIYRFWKYDEQTYQIYFDSGEHRDAPEITGYVRGTMRGVYTIAPLKRKHRKRRATAASNPSSVLVDEECLLSKVVQIDPKGWIPTRSMFRNQGYGDAFGILALHQMLDVKEALDAERFVTVTVNFDANEYKKMSRRLQRGSNDPFDRANSQERDSIFHRRPSRSQQQVFAPTLDACESGDASDDDENLSSYDFAYAGRESISASDAIDARHLSSPTNQASAMGNIMSIPTPTVRDWWAEPDANSFRVRGKTYKADKKKINAGETLFKLFAVDIIECDSPIYSLCMHPKERVQLALKREKDARNAGLENQDAPPFVFAVNIVMPGPPNYHMVFYYAVDDLAKINGSDGSPHSTLCNEFIFGDDDHFRDNTFKLIPQIIEGNFMVRKAVGCTPAIMGNKIKQSYFKGDRFFEISIDTGSSSVAAGTIRICNGYARMIVVDLAFLFEGYDQTTLPEKVLGCVRLKNVDFGKKLRFVTSF